MDLEVIQIESADAVVIRSGGGEDEDPKTLIRELQERYPHQTVILLSGDTVFGTLPSRELKDLLVGIVDLRKPSPTSGS